MIINIILVCTVLQAGAGLFIAFTNASDFQASLREPETYAKDMPKESRMVKLGLLAFVLSPLAILSVPAALLFLLGWSLKKTVQYFMPALKYDGSMM